MTDVEALVERAAAHDPHAVARVVSLFEDRRPASGPDRDRALALLLARAADRGGRGAILGLTGTPGSGKSSLLARTTEAALAADDQVRLAVVAVDPSSPTSGGALLGDRTRMRPSRAGDRIYFRSQASDNALGGLAPTTYDVARVLACLFDAVLVETVGIGQSEADIRHLADRVYLVVSPLGGDEVQYLKAGIIEIPDAFIVSKWDEPAASRAYHQLKGSLWLARPFDAEDVPIFRTSAQDGYGIDELVADVLRMARAPQTDDGEAAAYFFGRWVSTEWGRAGDRHLAERGGAAAVLDGSPGTEADRQAFRRSLVTALDA